ncbi:hypothetical protein IWX81_001146 [Salinibacterium sp. CAN_S4]|uniref:hypothetical protein n=1 Tax=Salinibacterium sp. CAN_S4 TaxID=2787727 RepID=UPI0018EFEF3E
MNHESFDRMLTIAGKTTLEGDASVRHSLLAVSQQAKRESHRSRQQVKNFVPLIALGALALTGAAAAWMTSVQPDVLVPVAYTTDAGQSFECVIYLEVPDPELRAYLQATDWDGVGQRIYDHALAASLAANIDDLSFDSTVERESWEWFAASDEFTVGSVPAELLPANDVVAASDSSCTGDLH